MAAEAHGQMPSLSTAKLGAIALPIYKLIQCVSKNIPDVLAITRESIVGFS